MDKVTEAIAHFIGLFQVAVEESRLRDKYLEFDEASAPAETMPRLVPVDYRSAAPHQFQEMEPELRHIPMPPEVEKLPVDSAVTPAFFSGPSPWLNVQLGDAGYLTPVRFAVSAAAAAPGQQLTPPGSVAAIIAQENVLQDIDYLVMGDGVAFLPIAGIARDPAALLQQAEVFLPVSGGTLPGAPDSMKGFVTAMPARLDLVQDAAGPDIFSVRGEGVAGQFLEGEAVDVLPQLADHRIRNSESDDESPLPPRGLQDNGGKEAQGEQSLVIVSADGARSVSVETGGNTLVNEAALVSAMLDGTVFAVMGDSHEVNAIVQVNAWADGDLIGEAVGHWARAAGDGTEAFNLARFERVAAAGRGDEASQNIPTSFAFTRIDGDLIFINWLQQTNFVDDSDVAMLTTGGMKTMMSLGGNMAFNGISLAELGFHYDLVLVGGGLYDANIISQCNVLLDNDVVGGVTGFAGSAESLHSTSGNLLWNEAGIRTIGAANRFEPLPEHFREAAAKLSAGDMALPGAVYADSAFLGLEGLRVLYVSGDIFDIQYIGQTNVLGDSDQIALAMSKVQSAPDAQWSFASGGNELINVANILDVDGGAKTYVGGERYSDELLLQAELVDFGTHPAVRDADALVNEAVAFLVDEDDIASDGSFSPHHGSLAADTHDGMQSMLA